MKPTLLVASIALALGTLAACDRNSSPTPRSTSAAPSPSAPAGSGSSATTTPSTPSTPAPSSSAKNDGAHPPVQGQVDAKEGEQHKDFQQKGDGAGPKPGG